MRPLIIVIAIVLAAAGIMFALDKFKPKPEEQEVVPLITPVEVALAKREDIAVQLVSQGSLEAQTSTTAASEVSGKVIEVSPAFEAGAQFEEGDVLLRIDSADYESALAQAKSAVADAALAVEMEEAKAAQSLRDWKKLGRQKEASPLVKREPQLKSARARLTAAEASASKAERDLERTVLRAPYKGRILRTHTDVASFVSMGAPLADFYEANALEVRLPVSLSELTYLDLKEMGGKVILSTSSGETWPAEIVRQDAEIDRRSRSLHLVASLTDDIAANDPLLVPGLFVHAEIEGQTLEGVYPVERRALLGENEVLVVTKDDTLTRRQVTVARKEAQRVLIREGLEEGDRVCLSYVPNFIEGMQVRVTGREAN